MDDTISEASFGAFEDRLDGHDGWFDAEAAAVAKTGLKIGNRMVDIDDETARPLPLDDKANAAAAGAPPTDRKKRSQYKKK